MKLVLAEKPSVAQSIAKVLGAAKREDGYLEGNGYVVSWCVGHLVELAQPEVYDAKYSKWAYADLPIFPMDWQYEVSAGTKKQFGMFKEVADIKTSDQLHLPVPEAKFETVVVQPSEYQKDMVASLSERAADVHAGIVDPSVDNMLKITSDGRKLGLDQRLMNTLLPDDPDSKLNACVGNILRIWQDGQADKLTQLVFCDLSTPKNDGTFNVYDDVKTKLIANGVPAEEVAFIHDADTEAKKKDLFAKVRTGQVRVLLGSTQKMGAGTNVQDKLVAVHHLDVGWRPSDMTQRNGRIIRQGNRNKEVQVYQYVTEGTFDAYLYVRHEVA